MNSHFELSWTPDFTKKNNGVSCLSLVFRSCTCFGFGFSVPGCRHGPNVLHPASSIPAAELRCVCVLNFRLELLFVPGCTEFCVFRFCSSFLCV